MTRSGRPSLRGRASAPRGGGGAASRLVAAAALAVLAHAARPAGAATWFGLVDTGELFASTNQGPSWTIRSTLPVRDAVALAAGATSAELYLVSRSGGVYRSTDAGFDWVAVGAIAASDAVALAIPTDLSLVVLTRAGAVYRSIDQGTSFTAIADLTGSDHVSLSPAAQGRLYALTASGTVSESVDGGSSWTAKGAVAVSDAVQLRAIGSILYVVSAAGDVHRSSDAAVTWVGVGTLSQVGITGLARDLGTLIASTGAGEVAASTDGAGWTWRGAINQLTVSALAVDSPATTSVEPPTGGLASDLVTPWPNPARAGEALSIAFHLPLAETVEVALYDLAGRRMGFRPAERLPGGARVLTWNPRLSKPGLYFVALRFGAGESKKASLVVLR